MSEPKQLNVNVDFKQTQPIVSPDGRSKQELQLDAVGRRGSLRFSHCTLLKHFR